MSFFLISDSKWEAADHMVLSRRLISIVIHVLLTLLNSLIFTILSESSKIETYFIK